MMRCCCSYSSSAGPLSSAACSCDYDDDSGVVVVVEEWGLFIFHCCCSCLLCESIRRSSAIRRAVRQMLTVHCVIVIMIAAWCEARQMLGEISSPQSSKLCCRTKDEKHFRYESSSVLCILKKYPKATT